MFAKTWPERSRRLFSSFDPVIQRVHVSFTPEDVSAFIGKKSLLEVKPFLHR